MLTQTSRYALHLLGALLDHHPQRMGAQELSDLTGIPKNYLGKILNQLAKNGMVDSRKGWGGGFTVCPGAEGRPIKEVLQIFDGAERTESKDCAFGLPTCDSDHPCPLHAAWEKIRGGFADMIVTTTIGDLRSGDPAG